jgi:hypothetical protein
MASFSTTDLLSAVRTRGSIPTTSNVNNVNNTTNLLALATEELRIKLLPLIMSTREEFYVAIKDVTITAGTARYRIPSRASGTVLRDVQIVSGTDVYSLERLQSEYISTTSQSTPEGFYLEHNSVVLYPTPAASGDTLRLRYYLRPSRLVATNAAAQITSITTATNQVTCSSLPSAWTTSNTFDFISASSPYPTYGIDLAVTDIAGTTITFGATLPTELAVGDWVALADCTPFPQLPEEFQPVLAQMVVVKVLEAQGDRDGARAAGQDLAAITNNALGLITERVHGAPRKVLRRRWR